MAKKIEKLTDAQKARFPEFVDKWTKIGLSTKPANRAKSEKAIKGLYALAKLKEPRVIWLPCPISAALSATCYAAIMNGMKESGKGKSVRSAVGSAVGSAVRSAVGSAVDSAVDSAKFDSKASEAGRAFWGGSLWAHYPAWADYFNEVLAISIDRNYLDLCENCGFYWILNDVCFASERPREINLDDNGRLHSEKGMAISYPSEWGLFYWHGTAVPGEWITAKEKLTAKDAITWKNIEQRRAACEIVGWNNVLMQLNAKTIEKDDDPEIGELLEVDIPEIGKEKFLRVQCGTKRVFALPVPPDMKTALQANAWTYGIEEWQAFKPEVRT